MDINFTYKTLLVDVEVVGEKSHQRLSTKRWQLSKP
jgi:hypothetical protein